MLTLLPCFSLITIHWPHYHTWPHYPTLASLPYFDLITLLWPHYHTLALLPYFGVITILWPHCATLTSSLYGVFWPPLCVACPSLASRHYCRKATKHVMWLQVYTFGFPTASLHSINAHRWQAKRNILSVSRAVGLEIMNWGIWSFGLFNGLACEYPVCYSMDWLTNTQWASPWIGLGTPCGSVHALDWEHLRVKSRDCLESTLSASLVVGLGTPCELIQGMDLEPPLE